MPGIDGFINGRLSDFGLRIGGAAEDRRMWIVARREDRTQRSTLNNQQSTISE
jgi:hypothetical protein